MMETITLHESALVEEVEQLAKQEGLDSTDVVAEAVRHHLATYRQKRIAAETEAWYRLPSEERKGYAGQFVAVYGGQIVGSDADRLKLYLQMRERYGRQPVMIIEGSDELMPVYYVSGARRA